MHRKPKSLPSVGSAAVGTTVTLGMIAAACGVSPSTVSRILNGTARVSLDKREAVIRAIANFGYVPNPIARGLAGGRTMSVGVVTQAIASPFYGLALSGIEQELSLAGYSPLFVSGNWNPRDERRCIEILLARRVDGIIVLTGSLNDDELLAMAKSTPVVVTGRQLQGPGLFALDFNNFEAARLATDHLLQIGHRRIAFICGDPVHPDAAERLRGYAAALAAASLAYDPDLVLPGKYHEDSGAAAIAALLDRKTPFTAIFAANDQMAFGAALTLHRSGLRVPQDISLVGLDDLAGAGHSIPPLTTIHQAVDELGRLAASSLLQLLQGQTPTARMPEPRLVIRESTRAPAGAHTPQNL